MEQLVPEDVPGPEAGRRSAERPEKAGEPSPGPRPALPIHSGHQEQISG